jgi:phosphate transport system substrate-binding protein
MRVLAGILLTLRRIGLACGALASGTHANDLSAPPRHFRPIIRCVATGALGLAVACTLDGCGSGTKAPVETTNTSCGMGTLTGQGSSAQASAMTSLIKRYMAICPQASVTYQVTDSRSGQQAFIAGSVDFAGTDSVLSNPDQLQANARCAPGQAVHLPVVFGPIAITYDLPGVGGLQLSGRTLAKIFAGKLTAWDAPEIRADNPGVNLPPVAITPVHRADASGTTQNFTKYLSAVANSDWTFGADTTWQGPLGAAASGSSGIVSTIAKQAGAIGYVVLYYAQTAKLTTAKIRNGAGEFVGISEDAAAKTIASVDLGGTLDDFRLGMNYFSTIAGAYPIVQVTYELLCNAASQVDHTLMRSFLTFACSQDAQTSLLPLGYAPMPANLRNSLQSALAALG